MSVGSVPVNAAGSVSMTLAPGVVSPTQLVGRFNRYRIAHKIPGFNRWSPDLASQACAHAKHMAQRGYLYHNAIRASDWSRLGQIAGHIKSPTTRGLYDAYLASSLHRTAIRYPNATIVGDCAVHYHGRWFHVMNFKAPS